MPEVRTTSSTGGEKGMKEERYDLLPREALDAISRIYAFGATKYADHNWRRGYEWSKSYAAAMRHLTSFWSGETHDPESGLPHLAHAGFHIFAMLTWLEEQGEGGEFDDRYVPKHKQESEADLMNALGIADERRVMRLADLAYNAPRPPWGVDAGDPPSAEPEPEMGKTVRGAGVPLLPEQIDLTPYVEALGQMAENLARQVFVVDGGGTTTVELIQEYHNRG